MYKHPYPFESGLGLPETGSGFLELEADSGFLGKGTRRYEVLQNTEGIRASVSIYPSICTMCTSVFLEPGLGLLEAGSGLLEAGSGISEAVPHLSEDRT